jgi:hypothetical protein
MFLRTEFSSHTPVGSKLGEVNTSFGIDRDRAGELAVSSDNTHTDSITYLLISPERNELV